MSRSAASSVAKRLSHLALAAALLISVVLGAALPGAGHGSAPALYAQEPAPAEPVLPAAADAYPQESAGLPTEGPLLINPQTLGAHSVQTGDFDRDGDLDVLSAARDSGEIIWYRNSGGATPTFEPRLVGVVPGVYLAFPVDLNRDALLDVLAVSVGVVNPSAMAAAGPDFDDPAALQGAGSLIWFQNNGQPTPGFEQRVAAAGLNYPVSAAAADIDGDGDLDLVAATRDDNSVTWFQSSGGALPSFTPHLITNAARSAVSVDVGDVDRDGDLDVVSASEDDDRILLFLNNGSGGFSALVVRPGSPQPGLDFAKSVHIVDADGDGDLDIAYVSEDQNAAGWYANNGARPPAFTHQPLDTLAASHAKFITAADVDNDGDMDLLSAWSGLQGQGTGILLHRNNGATTPAFDPFTLTIAPVGARYVHAADLDNDGDLDLLTASREDGRVLWFRNLIPHRNAQLPPSSQRTLGVYTSSRHLIAADLDGDGDMDQISVADRDFIWHENNGAQPPVFSPHPIVSGIDGGRWADAVDLDRDGDIDLVLASTNNGTVFWYENNGARPPTFVERVAVNGLGGPRSVVHADIDGDGDMDLAVPSDEDSKLLWLENNGARPPGFTVRVVDQPELSIGYFRTVWPADMDRDGDIDLVSATSNGDRLLLYVNNGARPPTFSKREIGAADYPLHVHVDDVDRDGDLDVLVASEIDGHLSFFENDGRAGNFTKRTTDGNAPKIHAVATGDLDRDGDVDLVGAIESTNSIVWYENNGAHPPGFTKRTITDLAIVAHSAAVADIDGDGDLDVMGAARVNGLAAWFENQGGQFRLAESAFTQQTVPEGALATTTLAVHHLGRGSDAPLQIAALDIRFQNSSFHFLTTEELTARATALSVYADTLSNGRFDPGSDRLLLRETRLSLAENGRLLLSLRNATPPFNVGAGGAAILHVAVELLPGCAVDGAVRPWVRATGQTGVDALAGSPLVAEFQLSGGGALLESDPARQLRINEVSAYSLVDGYEVDDWIEIWNPGPLPVEMGGMYITDDTGKPRKYRLPGPLTLAPNGFLIIVADDDGDALHANFRLSRRGETIGLFDNDARNNRPLDIITFGDQPMNLTSGRLPDGSNTWAILPAPTRGGFNVLGGLSPRLYLPVVSNRAGC